MAVVYDQYLRCDCGNADFKEERIHSYSRQVLPRANKAVELQPIETQIKYICTACGKELPH